MSLQKIILTLLFIHKLASDLWIEELDEEITNLDERLEGFIPLTEEIKMEDDGN